MSKVVDDVVDSSGSVFSDLGLPSAPEDLLKVELARAIGNAARAREMTQVEIASLLNTDQAKVSAILRGQLQKFSLSRLFRYVTALGFDIDLRITTRTGDGPGRITVDGLEIPNVR